ncbi:MAG: aldo/keto reductase [Verrucomicrobiota bacterium]
MNKSNRRDFFKTLAGLTSGLLIPQRSFPLESSALPDKISERLPLRKLGKTGAKVTMLGLGGYHIGWTTEEEARETIETALEGGIRFFDTAESYGNGRGEERYGKYLVPD